MELLYDTLTPDNLVVSADDRGLMEKVRPPRDPTTCRPRCFACAGVLTCEVRGDPPAQTCFFFALPPSELTSDRQQTWSEMTRGAGPHSMDCPLKR